MLKRALIASAVLAATTGIAFANGGSFVPPPPAHTGAFYVGAAISGDAGEFKTSGTNAFSHIGRDSDDNFSTVTNLNFDWAGFGVNGELYAGYAMVFQDHYTLALEGFGSVNSLKGNLNFAAIATAGDDVAVAADNARVKQDWTLGIGILPGVKLSDSTTLYARIAYVNSRFKVNDNGFATDVTLPFGLLDGFPIDFSKNRSGIQLGLGMSTMICPNVALRGEYRWERYGNVNVTDVFSFGDERRIASGAGDEDRRDENIDTGNLRIKPTIQSFNLGLTYFFHAV